jgi:hypothetical protein
MASRMIRELAIIVGRTTIKRGITKIILQP